MNLAQKTSESAVGASAFPAAGLQLGGDLQGRANEHFVCFFEDDESLVASVATFLGAGLGAGEGAIVIATPAHRQALAERLKANGIDVATLQSRGQYVSLDAAETLALFMGGEMPDETRFRDVIGKCVVDTPKGRSGLRAFGEMVALLVAQGKTAAALRLEQLWNELGEIHSFKLLCAYPMSRFREAARGEDFTRICNEHTCAFPAETFPAPGTYTERLRLVAELQQRAGALEVEVSRRKRAEEESRSREAYLQAIIDNTPECVKVVAPDGTLLSINNAGLHMVEAESVEQVLGISVFDLIAPECRDAFRAMHKCVCAGTKERLEYEIVGLKHTRRWVETHAVPIVDRHANQHVHLAVTRDISERQRADEAQRQLAAIVESSDDAIVSKNLNGIIMSWNRGAERVFGYKTEEVVGKPVTILMPPERMDEEPGILARIRKGERIEHYETVRRRKDGGLLNVSLTVSPVKDASGRVIGASKIARDITDTVRAKEKLEQVVAERTAQLRDTVAELEAFSYSVAHDMRAPLRSMSSYARFLELDFAQSLPDQGKEFARRITASAQRLDALITDVLNYSKVSRGEMTLEKVDVGKLTREIVDSYPDLQQSGAKILVQSPIPPVLGNVAALTQCISNLLSNAIKFVAPGTVPQVRVCAEKSADMIRISIEDNGIGISEEGQKRIFRMFQRLNPVDSFEGTGIGLTIVRKAVERMGGRVGVESTPGLGSKFWVELKRAV